MPCWCAKVNLDVYYSLEVRDRAAMLIKSPQATISLRPMNSLPNFHTKLLDDEHPKWNGIFNIILLNYSATFWHFFHVKKMIFQIGKATSLYSTTRFNYQEHPRWSNGYDFCLSHRRSGFDSPSRNTFCFSFFFLVTWYILLAQDDTCWYQSHYPSINTMQFSSFSQSYWTKPTSLIAPHIS